MDLHTAVRVNDLERVKRLLVDPEIDPNILDMCGSSAFNYAYSNGSEDSVRLFLQCPRADLRIKYFAACRRPLDLFLNYDLIKLWVEHPNYQINRADEHGFTLMHICINLQDERCLKSVLSHPEINVNNIDCFSKMTPLVCALSFHGTFHIKLLLDHPDIDITIAETPGNSAFNLACIVQQHENIVPLFLECGKVIPLDHLETGLATLKRKRLDEAAGRVERHIKNQVAADVFSLIIFYCDEFFDFK